MSKRELRAGRRIPVDGVENIPERFRAEGAILPNPLPSWVELSHGALEAMSYADYQLGRLAEAPSRLPDSSFVVKVTRWLETKYTLALAGSHRSLLEVIKADLSAPAGEEELVRQVKRYIGIARRAVAQVAGGDAVGATILGVAAEMLAEDQGVATDDETPWRTEVTWLGGSTADTAVLLPVPPGAELRAGAAQWKAWVDGEGEDKVRLASMAKAALGFFQFLTLFPVRHSGFLARLYVVLELIHAKRLPDQFLPVSVFLDRQRDHYWSRHRELLRTGDYGEWVAFFATGIGDLCQTQIDLVEGLDNIRRLHKKAIKGKTNDGFTRLVNSLTSSPLSDYAQIAKRINVTIRQCRDLVTRASHAGLIREVGRSDRKKIFAVPDVIDLLGIYEGHSRPGDQRVFFTGD
jgi:hypothetical protein